MLSERRTLACVSDAIEQCCALRSGPLIRLRIQIDILGSHRHDDHGQVGKDFAYVVTKRIYDSSLPDAELEEDN